MGTIFLFLIALPTKMVLTYLPHLKWFWYLPKGCKLNCNSSDAPKRKINNTVQNQIQMMAFLLTVLCHCFLITMRWKLNCTYLYTIILSFFWKVTTMLNFTNDPKHPAILCACEYSVSDSLINCIIILLLMLVHQNFSFWVNAVSCQEIHFTDNFTIKFIKL